MPTPPKRSADLRRRQEGQDHQGVCAVAWRAQQRLHSRWAHLRTHRGKPAGKVIVACARELSGFLGEAATITRTGSPSALPVRQRATQRPD